MFEFSMNNNEMREVRLDNMSYSDLYFESADFGSSSEWHKRDNEASIITMIRRYISIFFNYMDKKPKSFAIVDDSVYLSFDDIDKTEKEYIFFKNTIRIIDDIFGKEVDKKLW